MKRLVSVLFLWFFLIGILLPQQLNLPQASQKAFVSQTVGLTDISISYHRPGVKGREIWGHLVPYDVVWRAGANENTTITFSDEVMIEGKSLPAGTYGLHMIPTRDDWTIIFSNNNWSWGSFSYDDKEDALRVKVKPAAADFQEWLDYTFENPSANSVEIVLHWEKIAVPINISIGKNVASEHFRKDLEGINKFSWQPWNQAANYALQNNLDLDEALGWVDHSINMNKNFQNLWTKANILEKKGSTTEAEKMKKEAWAVSNEADINNLGYQYLGANQVDKAIETFKKNVEDHPESWNTYDSLAEGYAAKGEKKLAIQYYQKAYDMVKDDANKTRITNVLKGLASN